MRRLAEHRHLAVRDWIGGIMPGLSWGNGCWITGLRLYAICIVCLPDQQAGALGLSEQGRYFSSSRMPGNGACNG